MSARLGTAVALYLTRTQVCARLSISRATSYRLERGGYLPRPVRIGPGTLRFLRSEIEALERRAADDRGVAR